MAYKGEAIYLLNGTTLSRISLLNFQKDSVIVASQNSDFQQIIGTNKGCAVLYFDRSKQYEIEEARSLYIDFYNEKLEIERKDTFLVPVGSHILEEDFKFSYLYFDSKQNYYFFVDTMGDVLIIEKKTWSGRFSHNITIDPADGTIYHNKLNNNGYNIFVNNANDVIISPVKGEIKQFSVINGNLFFYHYGTFYYKSNSSEEWKSGKFTGFNVYKRGDSMLYNISADTLNIIHF